MVEKAERKVEDIHAEYSQLCAKAGHLQYQIHVLTKDLGLLNEQLMNLNFEASAKVAKEKESKDGQV